MKEIKNARIESTKLGDVYNGIMGINICFDFGGSGQCLGGWAVDQPIKDKRGKFLKRLGTAEGMRRILRILEVVGVESWEELQGKYVRVECDHSHIFRIGNILKENWIEFSKEGEE